MTLVAFVLTLSLASGTATVSEPIRVYIYAQQPAGGFVDEESERRADSADDMRRALRKTKGMVLVDDGAEAEVVVEVVSSADEPTGEWIGTRTRILGRISSERSQEVTEHTVRAVIRVADYEHEVVGQTHSILWRDAAKAASKEVRDWLKDNADRVRAMRTR
jgi:hypothetical protein